MKDWLEPATFVGVFILTCGLQMMIQGGVSFPILPDFFTSSSSSSSSSSKVRENGKIPGYSSCVEEMIRNNPKAKQRVCCDKLGGSWSQKGSFGTCRK